MPTASAAPLPVNPETLWRSCGPTTGKLRSAEPASRCCRLGSPWRKKPTVLKKSSRSGKSETKP